MTVGNVEWQPVVQQVTTIDTASDSGCQQVTTNNDEWLLFFKKERDPPLCSLKKTL